jgi:NTE family protein
MVGDPPDVVLEPRLGHFELFDFHKADEAIEEGRASVTRKEHELERLASDGARGDSPRTDPP